MDPLRRPKAPPFAFPRARELHFQGLGEGPAPHDCLVARSGLMWTGGEEGLACDFGRVRRFKQSRLGTTRSARKVVPYAGQTPLFRTKCAAVAKLKPTKWPDPRNRPSPDGPVPALGPGEIIPCRANSPPLARRRLKRCTSLRGYSRRGSVCKSRTSILRQLVSHILPLDCGPISCITRPQASDSREQSSPGVRGEEQCALASQSAAQE
jgi:hypothetical protein